MGQHSCFGWKHPKIKSGPVLQHPVRAEHREGLHIGRGFEWEDRIWFISLGEGTVPSGDRAGDGELGDDAEKQRVLGEAGRLKLKSSRCRSPLRRVT